MKDLTTYRLSDFFFSPIQVRPVVGALFGLVIGSFFSPFGSLIGAINGFLLAFTYTFLNERLETDRRYKRTLTEKLNAEFSKRELAMKMDFDRRIKELQRQHQKEVKSKDREREEMIHSLFEQFQSELVRLADLHQKTQQEKNAYAEANSIFTLMGRSVTALLKINTFDSSIINNSDLITSHEANENVIPMTVQPWETFAE
jgi:hypothetical protein